MSDVLTQEAAMSTEVFPRVRLAAAQAAPVFLDRERTVDKACRIIEEAGANGADVIGFPEGFLPAHPVWYYHHPVGSEESFDFATRLFHNAVEVPSDATEALCAAARHADCNVVMGLCERRPGTSGTMFNTQLFISRRGDIIGKRQKLVPTVGERQVHAPGSGAGVRTFETDIGPIGGLICGENSNPLAIYGLIAQNIRVHVASWPHYFLPTWPSPMANTATLTGRSTAYMAKCFVINACGTITDDMRDQLPVTEADREYLADPDNLGGSTIIAPNGDIVTGPAGPGEEILYADVDLSTIVRAKLVHDFAGHYQRHDVFRFEIAPSSPHAPAEADAPRAEQESRRGERREGALLLDAPPDAATPDDGDRVLEHQQ
jgi:nitrilase